VLALVVGDSHADGLFGHIGQTAQLLRVGHGQRKVNADYDVSAHGAGNVRRQIVHQPAIHQDAAMVFHRGDQPGDGDTGAHGARKAAGIQSDGASGAKVGGDGTEWRGQLSEALYRLSLIHI